MKDFQRLPLNSLKAFEAVARLGSYRDAAQELCVTQGAVGQQVKKLERHLATVLVEKQGRGVVLSSAGQRLFHQLKPTLIKLAAMTRSINLDSEQGPLTVGCSSDTAVLWLVPALAEFYQLHPDIELDIRHIQHHEDDLIDVDIAIVNQLPEASPFNWSLLSDQFFFPVCRPDLLKHSATMPLLHADRGGLWAAWFREAELTHPEQQHYLPGGAAVISGAIAGLGIALAHHLEVKQALQNQQLVRLSPHQIKAAQAYFIATPCEQTSFKAKLFISWLTQYCQHNRQ